MCEAARLYRRGWDRNGEWFCHKCGTLIGKNLNGDKPYYLAQKHAEECCGGKDKNEIMKRY